MALKIGNSQFAEDVIKNRRRILDRLIALHHACRFKAGEGEGFHILFKWHAILKTERDGDCEVIHHRTESSAFFVHIDEDFTQTSILVFARCDINLVTTNTRFLRIALAAIWHFLTFANLTFHDTLDDFLSHFLNLRCLWHCCQFFHGIERLIFIHIFVFKKGCVEGLR